MFESVRRFLKLEAASGLMLMAATVFALLISNSPLQGLYEQLITLNLTISVEKFIVSKPLLLWINDGLMAFFFLMVGLELKREALQGELNSSKKVLLPALGAFGGMLVPALIYAVINSQDDIAIRGWAIPTSTDIAFALGVLVLLGDRVPNSLKIFLVSLAIFDDIGAILIIAILYTEQLSFDAMFISLICIVILGLMNYSGIVSKSAYLLVGWIMWVAWLKSGVHATLAGVVLAMFIPMKGIDWDDQKAYPLQELEKDLHAPVSFFIVPLFAFANSGLDLSILNIKDIFDGVPLGIILGLFVGKQIGVMSMVYFALKLKLGTLPKSVTSRQIYGIAVLCGVGFTMSLFIGSLSFSHVGTEFVMQSRLGVLVASSVSIVWAVIWFRFFCKKPKI